MQWIARRLRRQNVILESPDVVRLHHRLLVVLATREALRWGAAWIAVWATATVLFRGLMWSDRAPLLWGALGLIGVVAVAIYRASRKVPNGTALLAAIDSHSRSGGILMTSGEQEIGLWQERISPIKLPQIRWNARREWRFLAAGLGFLIFAFAIPDRVISQDKEARLEIEEEVQQLTDSLQLLLEEEVVKESEAEELKQSLEEIQQEARGRDPEKTLEAIDHLNAMLSKSAANSANDILQQVQSAADVEAAAETLAGAQAEGNASAMGDAMKNLAQQMEHAAREGALLNWDSTGTTENDTTEMMANALRDGSLTPDQMKDLMELLKKCKGCRGERLKRLSDRRLIDPEFLVQCERACNSACVGKRPGRGGISRGRGDTEMTWKQPSEMGDAQFKEKALPPGGMTTLKEAPLIGLSAADPTVKEPTESSTGDALKSARPGSGEAPTQRLLPQYKRTVQQYFERGGK